MLILSLGCQTNPETVELSATKAPTATTMPAVTLEPSPAAEMTMTLEEKVDAFRSGKIDFPTDMNPEQYSAFIDDMNNHVGRNPIWVEATDNRNGNKVVLYFDTSKSKMVTLQGSYEENKEIIDQNALEIFVKIGKEPGTGNIQFTNPDGKLITVPNSANVNWNQAVDETNYRSGIIDLPTLVKSENTDEWYDKIIGGISSYPVIQQLKQTFVSGILMDDTVSNIVSLQNGWNRYPCLDILFIRTDIEGNPLYGVRTMIGGGPSIYVGDEGGTIDASTPGTVYLQDTDDIKRFNAGEVYYVGVAKNQQIVWQEANMADIDSLQGVGSVADAYENAINNNMPDDGNIVLAGSIFIKKK